MPGQVKAEFLMYMSYMGALLAIEKGYYSIATFLIRNVKYMVKEYGMDFAVKPNKLFLMVRRKRRRVVVVVVERGEEWWW